MCKQRKTDFEKQLRKGASVFFTYSLNIKKMYVPLTSHPFLKCVRTLKKNAGLIGSNIDSLKVNLNPTV